MHRLTKSTLTFLTLILFSLTTSFAARPVPLIGAQVWIEPGQTPEQIDGWFKTLAEKDMKVTRMFIMWNFMETAPEKWDFSLYDQAFNSAEKYGVKVVATLMPNFGPAHRGFYYRTQDGAIPKTEAQLKESEYYIKTIVEHYKNHKALDTWMLYNEPGQMPSDDPLAISRYKVWLKDKYKDIKALNAAWITNFGSFDEVTYSKNWSSGGFSHPVSFIDWQNFWREHLTWYMQWVADHVRKHDTKHPLHVNPHGLFDILGKYNLPEWRKFLSSLGASIHPVWHLEQFKRNEFPQGISFLCDLIRGASEPNPFWVTELQGGHNIFTANQPVRPTPNEIAQWVWTGIGTGAQRVIFWTLNPRGKGGEAGEWALLNYQNKPSARLDKAGEIAKTIQKQAAFFKEAEPVLPQVYIILSLETLTLPERSLNPATAPAGRKAQAHLQAALGMYKALQMLGINAQIKHINDFGWTDKSNTPRLAILPDARALTAAQTRNIETFVSNGNKLIATGLTGIYDEEEGSLLMKKQPLENMVGAAIKEINPVGEKSSISVNGIEMPVHLWISELDNRNAEAIGQMGKEVVAVRKKQGRGEVLWIPALVDLGAWLYGAQPLSRLLAQEVEGYSKDLAFRLATPQAGIVMRTLQAKNRYLTIINNLHTEKQTVQLAATVPNKPTMIFGDANALKDGGKTVALEAGESVVVMWE